MLFGQKEECRGHPGGGRGNVTAGDYNNSTAPGLTVIARERERQLLCNRRWENMPALYHRPPRAASWLPASAARKSGRLMGSCNLTQNTQVNEVAGNSFSVFKLTLDPWQKELNKSLTETPRGVKPASVIVFPWITLLGAWKDLNDLR